MWSIADEERDFELQGALLCIHISLFLTLSPSVTAHNDGVCALKFNPG